MHGVGDAIVGVLANPLDEDTVLESADPGVPDEAAGEPAVETADVGGWKIRYAGAGQDGEVVLLAHGYGGTATPGCSCRSRPAAVQAAIEVAIARAP